MGRKSRLKREGRRLERMGSDGYNGFERNVLNKLATEFEAANGRRPQPGEAIADLEDGRVIVMPAKLLPR